MKELQMPASYGRIPEAEQFQIVGGGELADAWNDFTDRLRLDDLFFSGGVLSLSFSFVPMLLFHVFRSAYDFAENTYNNLVNWFGFHDDTLSALQSYTDEMRQKRQEREILPTGGIPNTGDPITLAALCLALSAAAGAGLWIGKKKEQ